MTARLRRRQHTGENLEVQVFFVAEAVCATLEDAGLVVQAFDDGRELVLPAALGRDPLPLHRATAPTGEAVVVDLAC